MTEKAIIFETGEGKVLTARGSTMFFKTTHASTNGAAFSLPRSEWDPKTFEERHYDIAHRVRLKAKFNKGFDAKVVATQYGWWQGCDALRLPGYDPLSPTGANHQFDSFTRARACQRRGRSPLAATVAFAKKVE